jgi:benzoate-CoA ligase
MRVMSTVPPALGAAFYNAAADLVDRNLGAERVGKVAYIDAAGTYTYGALGERVARFANVVRSLGIEPEQRLALALLDGIDFPTTFLGAIKAGAVPVPLNTLLPPADLAFVLDDSRAKAAVVSYELLPALREAARLAGWEGTLLVSRAPRDEALRHLDDELERVSPNAETAQTAGDDPCFWLYSSGSTGRPKGTVHVQTSMLATAEAFARGVLSMNENDVVFSASKFFFAYGLGNSLSFPLAVGATAVLLPGRATPEAVCDVLRRSAPTIFCGVPTLFAALLAHGDVPVKGAHRLRLCTSAGEALPEEIGRAWTERTGVEIVDGIGSTEMLHIFISNRPGAVRYGTTGFPVPGYRLRIVDEGGADVSPGELGELHVSGPTAAAHYWRNREKSRATFAGEWVRTGDKFFTAPDGAFVYAGRVDDMLKVGGIWVSPAEVEGALIGHPAVLEAAVIGTADDGGLIKPKAFVVVKPGYTGDAATGDELKAFIKGKLAPYKYPRWIEFVDDLPKTPTGKIQRHVLRKRESDRRATV